MPSIKGTVLVANLSHVSSGPKVEGNVGYNVGRHMLESTSCEAHTLGQLMEKLIEESSQVREFAKC